MRVDRRFLKRQAKEEGGTRLFITIVTVLASLRRFLGRLHPLDVGTLRTLRNRGIRDKPCKDDRSRKDTFCGGVFNRGWGKYVESVSRDVKCAGENLCVRLSQ